MQMLKIICRGEPIGSPLFRTRTFLKKGIQK